MEPGDVLDGRFRIEREAGSGAMGVVFLAHDLHADEPVAVKVLKGDRGQNARFQREAKVLAQLRHPAIVRYVAHGITAVNELFLVMQWLEGDDLAVRLQAGPLAARDALHLARNVADALATAHRRGIVHRDLKPSNLFLTGGDVRAPKLLDFGIARVQNATAAMTAAGAIVGTPGYMAPEQARGDQAIDARADVFSLGCVLFECLTGRPAFMADNLLALLAKILIEEPPRASELCPGLPAPIDDLVLRMMAKAAGERPCDGAACHDAIAAVEELADELGAESLSAPRSAITRGEQHLVSVVIAAGRRASATGPGTVSLEGDAHEEEAPSISIGFEELASIDAGTAATVQRQSPGVAPLARTELGVPAIDVLARFGAHVERLADGALVASLHGTGAATDQAAQAARCALALRRIVPEAPIVLATGRAVFAGRLPIGAVIERAAKLLKIVERSGAAVGPPPIHLDDVTAGLLPSRFRVREGAAGSELTGEEHGADVARTVLGRTMRFVGRDAEMGTLTGLYAQVELDGVARAVIVSGAPGLGKSRLREELVARLRARDVVPQIWIGSAESLGAGTPFGILGRILGSAVGGPMDRGRVVERVGRRVLAADATRVATFMAELAGVPLDAAPPVPHAEVHLKAARREPPLMAEQLQRAFVDFLRAECEAEPVVVILEDAHWGDLPTMKLLDAALRELAESPLLVLAFARPEIEDAFPGLWADRSVLRLSLGALTARASERLAKGILGADADLDVVRRLVAQAGGNPFFLEELLRASASGAPGTMPETVLAVVQKRLESMEEGARRLLRAASVFGGVFWRGALGSLLGADAGEIDLGLADLVEREVLVRHSESRISGEVEHAFRHAFVRDAAYQMLTDADRTMGHRYAGEWLESAGETNHALLAEHFERGGDKSRATRSYALAAAQALHADDLAGCLALAKRGLAVADAESDLRGALHLARAEAHHWRAEFDDARAEGLEALHLIEPGSDAWLGAMAVTVGACAVLGRTDEAVELARDLVRAGAGARPAFFVAAAQCAPYLPSGETVDALLALLPDEGAGATDSLLLARVHVARATRAQATGDPALVLDHFIRAGEEFDRAGHLRGARAARGNAGYASTELGRHEEAEAILRGAIEEARRAGALGTVAWTAMHLGVVLGRLERPGEAMSVEREAMDLARKQGNRRLEAEVLVAMADILNASGAPDLAAEQAGRALTAAPETPALLIAALSALSTAQAALGDATAAHATARQAIEILERERGVEDVEPAARLAFAEALLAIGAAAATEAARHAKETVLGRADKIKDPTLRETFLRRVPANARILRLAGAC